MTVLLKKYYKVRDVYINEEDKLILEYLNVPIRIDFDKKRYVRKNVAIQTMRFDPYISRIGSSATLEPSGTQPVYMKTASVFTTTPTGDCTFKAKGGIEGQRVSFIITTSGTTARVLTFGENFKTAGTLSTGTVTGKVFQISFVCKDGDLWVEESRTAAM